MKKVQSSVISPLTGENKRGGGIIKAALALLAAASISAAPVLIEAYQEGVIMILPFDTVPVVELSFSVDTSCYVLFTAGGLADWTTMILRFDGTDLFPVAMVREQHPSSIHIVYTYPLNTGDHIAHLRVAGTGSSFQGRCYNAYLQALIFLPDTATAVAEQPVGDSQPSVNTPGLISKGPFVHVAGASELVDATGRVIENAIEDNKVFISNLPQGTYFARDGERTIVKIVKVE